MNGTANTAGAAPEAPLLGLEEQWSLGVRLSLSLATAGCLVVALIVWLLRPDQQAIAELIAGVGAALVAVPSLAAAWRSLRQPSLHGIMDLLIAAALLAAWAAGDLVVAALLPLVMMLGHILEERSLLGSHEAIRALSRLTQTKARRLEADGGIAEIAASELRIGDRVELRAGDRVPADGVVESGNSSLDTASITGESVPVDVQPGADVFNGSINVDGQLIVRVTRVGAETTLGRVVALLREAEQAKPPVTRLLERYAQQYLVLVLLLAAGCWFATGSTAIMLAVMVASCPCALVLAAPATSIAALSVASRHGILVKGAAFLETLATVDAVAFDKTGTLTLGELRLVGVLPQPGVARADLLNLAANLGSASSHPVSRAVAAELPESGRLPLTDIRELRGLGICARSGGDALAMGRAALFDQLGIAVPAAPAHDGPISGVARGARFLGWLLLNDEPRPEAARAAADLRGLGLGRQMLISGDRWPAAQRVAHLVGLTEVQAELLPAQKMQCVLDLAAQGHRPLVVGDGINDALALKAGAIGVAMGAQGTDVALASADVVLMTADLRRLGTCVRLSRLCRRTIYVNVAVGLIWTLVVLILAAAGVLGAYGALVAALAQQASSVIVIVNAGRLLKFHEAADMKA
ncbi:heavy metal translocating P-type ATPase [Solimonas soli]|uniref:heavy metal translocating P-type ATPase n=1 Tax=Solimonas soli TaxID=413479 RepID=UPI000481F27F|nr:cation-translocating P-type ATPase [Solimonas soli]